MISFLNNRNKNRFNGGLLMSSQPRSSAPDFVPPNGLLFKSKIKQGKPDIENEESIIYKNDKFNWVHYLLLYQDLVESGIVTSASALQHWINNGINENRRSILNDDELSDYLFLYQSLKSVIKDNFSDLKMDEIIKNKYSLEEKKLFEEHPHIFHKYLLFLRDQHEPMNYKISKFSHIDKNLVCAIHCYDLNCLYEYFNEYIETIKKHFCIVVTYCVENMDVINFYDFTFIYTQNKGMDIGSKFVVTNFLNSHNVDFSYVFFIHSKSDPEKRKKYIYPFIENIDSINKKLNKDKTIGGIFPNLFYYGRFKITDILLYENVNGTNFGMNSNIVDELNRYYNLPKNLIFTEGNVYILNKDVVNELFSDLKIYNVLNDGMSFDYNWVKAFYFLNGSIADIYSHFKTHNLFGNTNYFTMGEKEKAMVRDFMIEHAFERMAISSVLKQNKKIICAKFGNTAIDNSLKSLLNYLNKESINKSYEFNKTMNYINSNLAGTFNYLDYLNLNKDLYAHFQSPEKAVEHWLNHGIYENRPFNKKAVDNEYFQFLNMKFYEENFNLNSMYYSKFGYECKHSNEIQYKAIHMNIFCETIEKTHVDSLNCYNSLLFVVDFPLLGGGTTMFLDSIVSKYKHSQTFLIYRRLQDKNYLFVNDDIMLERGFEDDEFVHLLQTWAFKISKIFINSVVGHTKPILDFILTLNKEVTSITHDHSLFYKNPQMYYHDHYYEESITSAIDINNINLLVSQNEANSNIFGKFLLENKNVVFSELPDYKKSLSIVNTNNENIVIGINGNISYIKGFILLQKLIEMFSKWGNVKLVIFGHSLDPGYPYQYKYKNIEEFNSLLEEHKPNLWLETSLWPETYSYTLTQIMLTQLPILYLKKRFPSAIENRLANYSNAYSFDDVESIKYPFLQSIKQSYFYTIEPILYYGNFWEDYFNNLTSVITQNKEKNVVFISSKIYTSNAEFTYVSTRSIYSPAERFAQTLNTIESIRNHIPDSFIILFDNSDFPMEEINLLNTRVDVFINIKNDPIINDFTNVKTTKAYGELAQTRAALNYITNNLKYLKIKQFFKISGRYIINDTFNYSVYDNEHNIFKRNSDVYDRRYYYTSFYKISSCNFDIYCKVIENMYIDSKNNNNLDNEEWEVIVAKNLNYNFNEVMHLGITQNIAVWRQMDSI